MIAAAAARGCRSVAFTYNDPVIWAEYAIDTRRCLPRARHQDRGRHRRLHPPDARREFFARWTRPTST